MPQRAWNHKRERQYEHIKESQENRGVPEPTAKEIAARTVNKERARSGRVTPGQSYVGQRHFLRASGRVAVAPGGRRPQPRSALRGGETARHQRPLEDVETTARRSAGKVRVSENSMTYRFYGAQFRRLGLATPSGGYRFNNAS